MNQLYFIFYFGISVSILWAFILALKDFRNNLETIAVLLYEASLLAICLIGIYRYIENQN